ncbi:chalcone isomerase family protein [Alteromonas sp. H39]|uniref:chalcone isomerase family protein n=1 Tax=Alteromonas sp. H39 TaxID=3389876 RepID=UPI0039E13EF4
MLRTLCFLFFVVTYSSQAAIPAPVQERIPDASVVGEARFTYYFWDVYDAVLYAPQGKWPAERFALRLTYLRDFEGKEIAERSIKEMKSQGLDDDEKISSWLKAMNEIFPDINEDEHLLGVVGDSGEALFYQQDTLLGEVDDPEFTRWFFNIWVGEKTSEPDFRDKLINGE